MARTRRSDVPIYTSSPEEAGSIKKMRSMLPDLSLISSAKIVV